MQFFEQNVGHTICRLRLLLLKFSNCSSQAEMKNVLASNFHLFDSTRKGNNNNTRTDEDECKSWKSLTHWLTDWLTPFLAPPTQIKIVQLEISFSFFLSLDRSHALQALNVTLFRLLLWSILNFKFFSVSFHQEEDEDLFHPLVFSSLAAGWLLNSAPHSLENIFWQGIRCAFRCSGSNTRAARARWLTRWTVWTIFLSLSFSHSRQQQLLCLIAVHRQQTDRRWHRATLTIRKFSFQCLQRGGSSSGYIAGVVKYES